MVKTRRITIIISAVVAIVSTIIAIVFYAQLKIVPGLILTFNMVAALAIVFSYREPTFYLAIEYASIDIKGKSYKELRGERWFFENIDPDSIARLSKHYTYINKTLEKEFTRCKDKEDYDHFVRVANSYLKEIFCLYIYRSQTRYTQHNYAKTPYQGQVISWKAFYSADRMSELLMDKYGIYCRVNMPEYIENNNKTERR